MYLNVFKTPPKVYIQYMLYRLIPWIEYIDILTKRYT